MGPGPCRTRVEPVLVISMEDVEGARATRAFRHGREEHYDLISALIKSAARLGP